MDLTSLPVPDRLWVSAKVNCKMFHGLNAFVPLDFLLFPRPSA